MCIRDRCAGALAASATRSARRTSRAFVPVIPAFPDCCSMQDGWPGLGSQHCSWRWRSGFPTCSNARNDRGHEPAARKDAHHALAQQTPATPPALAHWWWMPSNSRPWQGFIHGDRRVVSRGRFQRLDCGHAGCGAVSYTHLDVYKRQASAARKSVARAKSAWPVRWPPPV